MVTQNKSSLTFTHFVEFKLDETLFCATRQGNRIQIYLILNHSGFVYTRQRGTWQIVDRDEGAVIRQAAAVHAQGRVPYYTTNIHFNN